MTDDWTLFEVPERYRSPKRRQKFPFWRKHTGARTSCDDCILALAHGEMRFAPDYAVYVRTDEGGRRFLCARHTHQRKVDER